jgi:hypothetical protein
MAAQVPKTLFRPNNKSCPNAKEHEHMKKVCILLLVSLALAATCLGQSAPTNQPDSPRIKPPTASPTPAPAPAIANNSATNSPQDAFIAREKEVWEAIRKKNMPVFAGYLAEDMLYVSKDGLHSKADTVKGIEATTIPEFTLDDWKVTMIDKDVALVTYRMSTKAVACGPEAVSERNSTIWAERGGKWLVVFHQDTTAEAGK